MPAQDADWPQIGKQLVRRRVDLDPAYRNRRAFAAARGIEYHLAYRAEKGLQSKFEEATKAVIERAYGLEEGSFDKTAATGTLFPLHVSGQLGEQLRRQCILLGDSLGRNYRDRSRFAAERFGGLPVADAYDLAYRAEHDPSALSEGERAAAERAYGLAGGSLTRSLTTGILEPAPGEAPSLADETAELERTLAWLGAGDRDEQDRKLGLILRRLRTPGPGAEGMRDTGSQAESA